MDSHNNMFLYESHDAKAIILSIVKLFSILDHCWLGLRGSADVRYYTFCTPIQILIGPSNG